MPNNFYRFKLEAEEPPLMQGDIFKNLPFYTTNFLISPADTKPSTSKIIKNTIKKEKPKLVESFLVPRWGILASQDCDILPDFDLIFYPMIITKESKEFSNINEFINNSINNTTRSFYLPKIRSDEIKNQKNPFQVLFQKPFIVPYNILISDDIFSKCWVARIIEPANRVFLGKLTSFFSRTPIDEVIFLENNEISLLVNYFWKNKIWKETKTRIDHNLFSKAFKKINEIINLLIMVNRKSDIKEICFFNKEFVKLIQEKLNLLIIENQDDHLDEIVDDCRYILNDNMDGACERMSNILNRVFLEHDSIINRYNTSEYQNRFESNINKLKNGEVIPNISERTFKNNKEIMGLGFKIERALIDLNLYDKISSQYLKLTSFLKGYYN